MKKRIMSLVVILLMGLVLAACQNKATDTATSQTAETETDKLVVGVSLLNNSHVFYNNIESAMQDEAKTANIELIVQDAAGDGNKQLNQVQDFITQEVDAIVIAPTNSAGSKSMVELAEAVDIPVFTMDVASDGDVISHIATDNYQGGELAAQYVVENLLPDKKGDVAVITYSEIESTVERENGFVDYLKANAPEITVVDVQNYSGDQGKAADVTQNMLLKHTNLDVIFAVGDPAAVGAMSSIDAVSSDVKVIGFDGNPEGIDAIKSGGNWVADVAQDPAAIGATTLQTIRRYKAGETVEKLIPIAPKMIDAETLK